MQFVLKAVALDGCEVFLTHEGGDWWPGDAKDHQFTPEEGEFTLSVPDGHLKSGEEFKLVVTGLSEPEAREAFEQRKAAGIMVGTRFDYDAGVFWLLMPGYEVARPGAWNQNSVMP
jgi:hypothetical protein